MVSDYLYEGRDYVFCGESVELAEWEPDVDYEDTGEVVEVLHNCDLGEEHDGAHKCSCGTEWDTEVPC